MAETAGQQQYPNLNPHTSTNGDTTKPASTMQSLSSGPVAEKAKAEADATKSELSNLAAARTTPERTTASGQKLTHYHSFFYELLSWSNPRATAIAYTLISLLIVAARYLPITRYALKGTYIILGITAAAEVAGKVVLGEGFATKIRPKKYYTIPHETLESVMEDLVELGNFFVIEFQRVVFAENVEVTVGVFLAAFLTYFLVKITPAWGLALLFTTLAFFVPLIYVSNQELIDHQIANGKDLFNQQANQVSDLVNQHAGSAIETTQNALKEYSAKAGELMGTAKKTAVEKGVVTQETADKLPGAAGATTATANGTATGVKKEDFPSAPRVEPVVNTEHGTTGEKEPLLA